MGAFSGGGAFGRGGAFSGRGGLGLAARGGKPVSLAALGLSNAKAVTNAKVGDAVGWIVGRAAGSTLSLTDASGKLSLSGQTLRVAASMSPGTINFLVTETLGAVTKATNLSLVVEAGIAGTALDPAQLGGPVFTETFLAAPDIWTPVHTSGKYATFYNFGADGTPVGRYANVGSRTLGPSNGAGNNEAEVYSDLAFNGIDPFSVFDGGGLRIAMKPTPAPILSAMYNLPVTSGMLRYLVATYTTGYFEVRGRADIALGLWPAFGWLIEATPSNGSEIDLSEIFGLLTPVYQTIHHPTSGSQDATVLNTNSADALHTYGVLLKTDTISFYIDGIQRGPVRARPTFSGPFHFLLNFAAGWYAPTPPGVLDLAILPKNMDVDYWRAYAISGTAPALPIPWTPSAAFGANLKSSIDASDTANLSASSGSFAGGAATLGSVKDAVTGADYPQYFKQGAGNANWRAVGRNGLPDINVTGQTFDKIDSLLVPADGAAVTIAFVGASAPSQADDYSSVVFRLGDGYGKTIDLETWGGNPAISTSLGRKASNGYSWTNQDRIVIASIAAGTNPAVKIWVDGQTVQNYTSTGTLDVDGTVYRLFESWKGWMQHALLVNRAITQTEAEKLTGYLAEKWASRSRLPAGHPYKSISPTI